MVFKSRSKSVYDDFEMTSEHFSKFFSHTRLNQLRLSSMRWSSDPKGILLAFSFNAVAIAGADDDGPMDAGCEKEALAIYDP